MDLFLLAYSHLHSSLRARFRTHLQSSSTFAPISTSPFIACSYMWFQILQLTRKRAFIISFTGMILGSWKKMWNILSSTRAELHIHVVWTLKDFSDYLITIFLNFPRKQNRKTDSSRKNIMPGWLTIDFLHNLPMLYSWHPGYGCYLPAPMPCLYM